MAQSKTQYVLLSISLILTLVTACVEPTPMVVATQEVLVTGEPVMVTATPYYSEKDTIIVCLPQIPSALLASIDGRALPIAMAAGNVILEADGGYGYQSRLLAEIPSVANGGITVSEDGTVVTYRFKEGMTWSDGQPFSVNDVIFSTQFLCQTDQAEMGNLCLTRPERVDDITLRVTLPQGMRPGPDTLPVDVLPEHLVGALAAADFTQGFLQVPNPVLGAYEYVKWVDNGNPRHDHVRLTQAADPWAGAPRTPELVYRFIPDSNMLLASILDTECDLIPGKAFSLDQQPLIRELAATGHITYQAVASPTWEQITMNTAPLSDAPDGGLAFFADARVRQAAAYGTNRERMIETLYGGDGQIMHSFLPDNHRGYLHEATGAYSYNPEQARALLSAAGWQDLDGDGFVEAFNDLTGDLGCGRGKWAIPAGTLFEVTYTTTARSELRQITAELFAEDMAAIGIKVNVEQVEEEALMGAEGRLARRTFQLASFAQTTEDRPEASDVFGGPNIYQTPEGNLAVATTLLAENPGLLFGIPLLERDFIMIQPPPERLPQGYTLVREGAIPAEENGSAGNNYAGWCDEAATLNAYEADQAIDEAGAVAALHALQARFLEEMPLLPLFQHIELDVRAPTLCGTGRGPRQTAARNVEEWYFAETCP